MSVEKPLRTAHLARAANLSVQQVRNDEAAGMLPPVNRSASGYRLYTARHLTALLTARKLVDGFGSERARTIMRSLHAGRLADALAVIDERHEQLAQTRTQLETTRRALDLLAQQLPAAVPHAGRLTVSEAARAVGVRPSAVRFWEQRGLLHPTRDQGNQYRLFDERQMRLLRVIALLRGADHDFDAIRLTLQELEAGHPQRTLAAIARREQALTQRSWRCLEGAAALFSYIREHLDSTALGMPPGSTPFQRAAP